MSSCSQLLPGELAIINILFNIMLYGNGAARMLEGIAELPLHEGHVPQWLIRLMKRLSKALIEVLVIEYGPRKVVERLSNPLWFQAFNNIIGMDWDSSGSTTVTTGILREVSWKSDLGILVLGGKGRRARRIPEELERAVEKLGLSDEYVKRLRDVSRIIAKVDSSLLQDGYQLYHQALILSEDGSWSIVQQGMNIEARMARRYHWFSEGLRSLVEEPHRGIACSRRENRIINLVASESRRVRSIILDLLKEPPRKTLNLIGEAYRVSKGYRSILEWTTHASKVVILKKDRLAYYKPLPNPLKLKGILESAYELRPRRLEEALLIKGLGPETIRALALISDLIYREPPSWRDPANYPYDPFKYAYAFGGKDGVPYPIKREEMERILEMLEKAVDEAKLEGGERSMLIRRLRSMRNNLERYENC